MFSLVRVVKWFAGERREKTRWNRHMDDLARKKIRGEALHELMLTFPTELASGLILGGVLGYGAFEIMNGALTVGGLIAFIGYSPRAHSAWRAVLTTYAGTRRVSISAEGLDALFSLPIESRRHGKEASVGDQVPAIEFSNVSFTYGRGFGLGDMSFVIQPGEFVGIVGASGGGKTTIVELLTGFRQPDSGRIRVNGVDITDVSLEHLRSIIAVVPQDILLWNDTLIQNISYPEEPVEDERALSAAKLVGIHDFIVEQPEGYATLAGEGGTALSGGERQRLAIARSLYKDPKILLMDEATSALDAISEKRVREAIDVAKQGRTTLVIAHRLSTVRNADRILVIQNGRLAESGTYQGLLDSSGIFAGLHQAQALSGWLSQANE